MSYDGTGTYSLPSPQYPAIPGALIKAADFNAIMLDLAAALSACMVRDGQSLATGAFNMNGKKITGLAAGSVNGDAVRYEQLTSIITAALVALGGLTPAADKFPYFTGATTAGQLTIVAAVRAVLAAATVADMRTAMGVAYGVIAGTVSEGNHTHTGVYQPADADLTAIAGLTSASDSFPYFTGSGTAGLLVIVSAIRTLLASADMATFRTNAGLAIGTNVQAYDVNICISDVTKSYTATHYPTPLTLTSSSGHIAFNNATCAYTKHTMTETTNLDAMTNRADGQAGELVITGAGSYTLSATATNGWKMVDGTSFNVALVAGKKTTIYWECDGTQNLVVGTKQEV